MAKLGFAAATKADCLAAEVISRDKACRTRETTSSPELGDKGLKSVATRGALISKSRGSGPFLAIFQTDYGHLVGGPGRRSAALAPRMAPHSRCDWVEGSCGKAIPCCEGSQIYCTASL